MRFIAEDNPNLYIDVENYSELEEKIKDFGNSDYNYEVIFEFHDPLIKNTFGESFAFSI